MALRTRDADRFRGALRGRPWLLLIEGDVYCMPERLLELDRDLFAVYNTRKERFEVHDASVPFSGLSYVLDAQALTPEVIHRLRRARRELDPITRVERESADERASEERSWDSERRGLSEHFAEALIRADDAGVWGQRVFQAAK